MFLHFSGLMVDAFQGTALVPSIQDYIDTVKSKYAQRICKIEILYSLPTPTDMYEAVIETLTPDITDGDLQITAESSSRRNCNILLDNSTGIYTPATPTLSNPSGSFWINTKYKVYTGYIVNGLEYNISRGIFVSGEPTVGSDGANKTVNLQLYDKWALLDGTLGGTLDVEYVAYVGASITDIVKAVFLDAGELKEPIIEPTTETLAWNLVKAAGNTYADILNELASMLSWVVYYDNNGYPRFEPPTDLETEGSSWDFVTTEINYLGSQHRYEYSKVKNYIVVIGNNINAPTNIKAIAENDGTGKYLNSPTQVSLIGKKVSVITDQLISTGVLAQARADYELEIATSLVETVNMESVPIDILDVDQVITVTDSSNGLNTDRYLVKNISFPLLNTGNQTLNVWKGVQ